jgi:DNA invertase Pin-like site-specific DNA recombinase
LTVSNTLRILDTVFQHERGEQMDRGEIIFGYGRVSTIDQHTGNQRKELMDAGYDIRDWFEETVSGGIPASERPEFQKLMASMKAHLRTGQKVALVVSKLDRLGRNAIDVQTTVRDLAADGIRVYVHQLGKLDLTSTAGKPMLAMLCAFAEFERDLLRERTKGGLATKKAQGVKLGRPAKTTEGDREEIRQKLAGGSSVSQVARDYGISRSTVISIRDSVPVC